MALSITQTPTQVNLAQSPTIFTVSESDTALLTSSSFQYILELSYWTGSKSSIPTTSNYTLQKFPNPSSVGIFDVSRVLASTFTDLVAENTSSAQYFRAETYVQYKTSTTGSFETGSHVTSSVFTAIDGYELFQETIGQDINTLTPHWPILSDGPVSQSYLTENAGEMSVFMGTSPSTSPTRIKYTGDINTAYFDLTSASNSTGTEIDVFPIGLQSDGFPLSGSTTQFTIQGYSGDTPLGTPISFELVCNKKYPNVRIKWKNRYGAFDYFNFNLVSRETFNTERSRFQPQIGSWAGSTLSYQKYESSIQNYITDSTLKLSVNTDYVDESYNDIFKQLLVSDEIYWVYDEGNDYVRPLAIDTSTFNIKTHVVDKLIQYQFDFTQGQGYKLIF
jgi:hypothetical protein